MHAHNTQSSPVFGLTAPVPAPALVRPPTSILICDLHSPIVGLPTYSTHHMLRDLVVINVVLKCIHIDLT